jgi:propanol-preferring alcohol dehydrogenase
VPFEVKVLRTIGGTRTDLSDVLALARRDLVRAEITAFSLDQAGEVLERLETNQVIGRGVVVPNAQ